MPVGIHRNPAPMLSQVAHGLSHEGRPMNVSDIIACRRNKDDSHSYGFDRSGVLSSSFVMLLTNIHQERFPFQEAVAKLSEKEKGLL